MRFGLSDMTINNREHSFSPVWNYVTCPICAVAALHQQMLPRVSDGCYDDYSVFVFSPSTLASTWPCSCSARPHSWPPPSPLPCRRARTSNCPTQSTKPNTSESTVPSCRNARRESDPADTDRHIRFLNQSSDRFPPKASRSLTVSDDPFRSGDACDWNKSGKSVVRGQYLFSVLHFKIKHDTYKLYIYIYV